MKSRKFATGRHTASQFRQASPIKRTAECMLCYESLQPPMFYELAAPASTRVVNTSSFSLSVFKLFVQLTIFIAS